MPNLRSIFFGSPPLGVGVLNALEKHGILPTVIVTTPPRPAGRGLAPTPSPLIAWAKERDIEVLTPEKLDETFCDEIRNTEWDVFLTASYGVIMPRSVLDLPKHGVLNVHPSLLPKFRGASPIRSTILAGERKTGVTVMLVDEKVDHGPIVAQASIEIHDWPPTSSMLSALLAEEGGNLLAEALPLWLKGEITPEEQRHEEATYTKKFTGDDARIDLADNPEKNLEKVRAFDKNPNAYFLTERNGKSVRVKIIDATIENGVFVPLRVVPEGKKEMSYADFMRGSRQ